jgi:Beta-ketoacyl synthase, N-terminal domain
VSALTAWVRGIGVLGPGLPDWPTTAAVLRAARPYVSQPTILPAPGVLPAAERRRAGRIIKLALAVGAQAVAHAGIDARELPTVFSSSGGDGDNCHEICVTLASDDRQISPTRFHNSVHNAASGYWSIAYGCTLASTSLCAGDASFGAGLLEAMTQLACGAPAVLLLAYDADYPPPLHAVRPIPDAFGIALLLSARDDGAYVARLELERLVDEVATSASHHALEQLRCAIPAARALPLLESLARPHSASAHSVVLDYLDNAHLSVRVSA